MQQLNSKLSVTTSSFSPCINQVTIMPNNKNVCSECNRKVDEELIGVTEPGWQGWLCDGCFDKYLNDELTDG